MFYKAIIEEYKGTDLEVLSKRFGCVDSANQEQVSFWEEMNKTQYSNDVPEEIQVEMSKYRQDWFRVSLSEGEHSVAVEYAQRYVDGQTIRDCYYVTPLKYVEQDDLDVYLQKICFSKNSYFWKSMSQLMYYIFKETKQKKALRFAYQTTYDNLGVHFLSRVGIVFIKDSLGFNELERDFNMLKSDVQVTFPLVHDMDEKSVYLVDSLNIVYLLDKNDQKENWCSAFFLKELDKTDANIVCNIKNIDNIRAFSRMSQYRKVGSWSKDDSSIVCWD